MVDVSDISPFFPLRGGLGEGGKSPDRGCVAFCLVKVDSRS